VPVVAFQWAAAVARVLPVVDSSDAFEIEGESAAGLASPAGWACFGLAQAAVVVEWAWFGCGMTVLEADLVAPPADSAELAEPGADSVAPRDGSVVPGVGSDEPEAGLAVLPDGSAGWVDRGADLAGPVVPEADLIGWGGQWDAEFPCRRRAVWRRRREQDALYSD
jgi:hypothetical protein